MKTQLHSLFIGLALITGLCQTTAQVTNLGIAPVAGRQSLLYWPVSTTNYVLQAVTNLTSTNWVAATNAVAVNAVAVTNSAPAGYFRLLAKSNPTTGMVLIPAGPFTMGNYLFCTSATNDLDIANAIATTNVYVSAFYMDVNLVSSNQWAPVYNYAVSHGYTFAHPGIAKGSNFPIFQLSWFDCAAWCNARSMQAGLAPCYSTDGGSMQVFTNAATFAFLYQNMTNSGYRLPTEAEWEKAARGGIAGSRFPWGNVITENQANYNASTNYYYDLSPYSGFNTNFSSLSGYSSPTAWFASNGYGLYDMAGNVSQWCWDWYPVPALPYQTGSPYLGGTDPAGPETGSGRVVRGGNWFDPASSLRCAFRAAASDASAQGGFRCVIRVN